MLQTSQRSILIIDDDKDSLETLNDLLSDEYTTLLATNGEDGVRLAREKQPDLILLDLMMPGMCGTRTCEALRMNELTRHITIVVITGASEQDPRVAVFTKGADDMVSKPYETRELLARIRSKIRRIEERNPTSTTSNQVIRCGNLTPDPEKLEVTNDEKPLAINVLRFNLLRYFLENMDRVISRQKILEAVWKDSVVSDRTVDTHMASLRRKLMGFNRTFKTIYSAGYILKSEGAQKANDASNAFVENIAI